MTSSRDLSLRVWAICKNRLRPARVNKHGGSSYGLGLLVEVVG